jgi:hypothetical protein
MVVNKSSETNTITPAAKEKYAASKMTLATAWLFVMTISSKSSDDRPHAPHVGSHGRNAIADQGINLG